MGGKRKRNVVLVADGVTVEKPILSKEEELQWEKRATHHAELLKKQQASEAMKLRIRQEKKRLREEEAEHRRRLIRSTKVAQIMTRIDEINQMRREIVEKEALVTREPIWDDKLDFFRKRNRFIGQPEIPEDQLPTCNGKCGACSSEPRLSELQLFRTSYGVPVWVCRPCRDLDEDIVRRKRELGDLRDRVAPLIKALRDANAGRSRIVENLLDVIEEVKISGSDSDESEDEGDHSLKKIRRGKWDVIAGPPPDYTLSSSTSLTGILPDLGAKLNRVRNYYMEVFQVYYYRGLIERSVSYRNSSIRSKFKGEHKPQMITFDDALARWKSQDGICSICNEKLQWWTKGHGKHNRPQIDRIGVANATYVDNFQWLCSFCNTNCLASNVPEAFVGTVSIVAA
jgi:hypothetical protein